MTHILNNFFDHIFVIAHPESLRFKTFAHNWEGLNFKKTVFVRQTIECYNHNGCARHTLGSIPDNLPLVDPLSDGQIACALAHMIVYQEIINNNIYNALILEDDSVFNGISNLEAGLNSDYDILSLFTADCDLLCHPITAAPFTGNYTRAGTSAYVIRTPGVARKLLGDQLKKMNTADGVIMRKEDMKIYAIYPPVCSCDGSPSMIATGFY